MPFLTLVVLLLAVLSVNADPVVVPESQQIQFPGSGSLKCVFASPLTECWVRVSEHFGDSFDTLIDFRAGAETPSVDLKGYFSASYAGAGLEAGDCGIKVDFLSFGNLLVECYGKTLDGRVDRGVGQINTFLNTEQPLTALTPRLLVAAPGTNVAVLYKANAELPLCYVVTPSAGLAYMQPGWGLPTGNRYLHHGAGPSKGECGAVLTNVQHEDAGVWRVTGSFSINLPMHSSLMTLVLVQAAPVGEPVLEIKDEGSLAAGRELVARCVAPSAVPHGNITWLLDGHVFRQDNLNDTLPEEVGTSRPWQPQPLHQTVRRQLTDGDLGKRLECRMDHVALAGPKTVGRKIGEATTTP